jgi:hypothetical protein
MYALGLEVVYGGYRRAAFQNVLTTSLEGADGSEHQVMRSDILLEIENGRGEVVTIRRSVKGSRDPRLLTVWEGSRLSHDASPLPDPQSYYLGFPWSAQNDRGFHSFLSTFLGYDLPSVPRYEGADVPLYLETIFPLFYIEQKRGWAALQLLTPTYYKIKDVQKRAFEYVLGLHVNETIAKRLHLIERRNKISEQWRKEVGRCKALVASVNGELRHLEENLSDQSKDRPSVDAIVMIDGKWRNLPSYLESLTKELAEHVDKDDVQVDPQGEAVAEMHRLEDELGRERLNARTVYDRYLREQTEIDTLNRRISVLMADRRRAIDVKRLSELHASDQDDTVMLNCPTCHQAVHDSLSPENIKGSVMTPDEHVSFIDGQVRAFNELLPLARRSVDLRAKELASARNSIAEREARLQGLRESRSQPGMGDLENLRRRARLEFKQERFGAVLEELRVRLGSLIDLHDQFHALRLQLQGLPETNLSFDDERLLVAFEERLAVLLSEFELESVRVNQIKLSRETYRPEFQGIDLDAQVSGSDHIRAMWSYVMALLEISADDSVSHHAGLLILDEPRQQEVSVSSFRGLCRRAANAGSRNQQIIFGSAAAETRNIVGGAGGNANIIAVEGRLIGKRERSSGLIR